MKKAVIYARFSCRTQTEQSIEGQLRVCHEFAKRNDIFIVNEYIDRARSGTNDSRPAFQLMMKECKKHEWEMVIVYKLDRFSRDKYDTAVHKHTLRENGVTVVSATENLPDTPEKIIFESMLEGMAQYYSAELSQKVQRGLRESYEKGQFTGGYNILGYDIVNKKCVINEYERAIVLEIFTKFAKGFTVPEIAEVLRDNGVKNKSGRLITDKMIYKMLVNPKYNGRAEHQGKVYTNIYPKIIDDDLWAQCNALHEKYKDMKRENRYAYGYLLSSRAFCGHCKGPLYGASGKGCMGTIYRYYSCRSRAKEHKNCPNKNVAKDWLEGLVLETTYKLFSELGIMDEIVRIECEMLNSENTDNLRIQVLETKREELQKQLDNLITAVSNGLVNDSIKDAISKNEEEIADIDCELAIEKARENNKLCPEVVKEYVKQAMIGTISDDIHFKRKIINNHVKRVIVYDTKVAIEYYLWTPRGPKGITPDDSGIVEVYDDEAAYEKAAFSFDVSYTNITSLPPSRDQTNYHFYGYVMPGFFIVMTNK